jgi:ABC-type uncharacterized transport system auxiliary subunit
MLGALTMTGCIRPNVVATVRYTIEPEISVTPAAESERTLGVRPLSSSVLYKLPMLYMEGLQVHEYPHSEWAMNPDDMVTRAIIDAITATNRFRDVGDASNVNRPDIILVGVLRRFEADRDVEPPEAVCEVRLELRETFGKQLLWADTLTARVPLEENRVPALARAMSQAVSQIANEAAREIAKR